MDKIRYWKDKDGLLLRKLKDINLQFPKEFQRRPLYEAKWLRTTDHHYSPVPFTVAAVRDYMLQHPDTVLMLRLIGKHYHCRSAHVRHS